MSSHDPLADAFERVTTGFYRQADPESAGLALRHWLRLLAAADEAQIGRLLVLFYVFARISQVSEAARGHFEPILRDYAGAHPEIVQRLLQLSDDPTFPGVLDRPLERPEQLDLLWAEFFVTGRPDAILRIVSVLDGPDRTRQRLEAWLHERSLLGGRARRTAADTLTSVGLVVDLERKVIVTSGDLDGLCFSIAEKKIPIFGHLPFALTPEEMQVVGLKGAALWSLRLNARDHEAVAEICRAESQRAGGPGRLRLTDATDAAARPFAL